MMPSPRPSDALALLGGYAGALMVALGVAAGIFYLCELIEEHTKRAVAVVKTAVAATVGAHALLVLTEGLPLATAAPSVAAQLAYWRLLNGNFPFVNMASEPVLTATAACAASNVMWLKSFQRGGFYEYETLDFAISLMLVVSWLVPLALLLTVSSGDAMLPHGAPAPTAGVSKTRRRAALLTFLDGVRGRAADSAQRALPHHRRAD